MLRAKGDVALARRLHRLIGSEQHVLVEQPGEGRTPCFAHVRFDAPSAPRDIVRVRIDAADGRALFGHAVRQSFRAVA